MHGIRLFVDKPSIYLIVFHCVGQKRDVCFSKKIENRNVFDFESERENRRGVNTNQFRVSFFFLYIPP